MFIRWDLLAGMPTYELTEIAKLRLDAISFFVVGVLLSAWGVQVLWNLLSRDIPKLPNIRYSTSLAGTILWGLLFMLVLTMISGARELMTPGAWRKDGYTYALVDEQIPAADVDSSSDAELLQARRERLELLRTMLWAYAAAHDGVFPESIETSGIAERLWQQPGVTVAKYGYQSGHSVAATNPPARLVFEYGVYEDGSQLLLMTDGSIEDATQQEQVADYNHHNGSGAGA